jgi:hypothetical protein
MSAASRCQPKFARSARATCPDGALPTTISQSVSSPRHHNVIQSVSFKKVFLKDTRHREDTIFVQTRIYFTQRCVILYIQNRSYVSDATTEVVSEFSKVLPLSTYQMRVNIL